MLSSSVIKDRNYIKMFFLMKLYLPVIIAVWQTSMSTQTLDYWLIIKKNEFEKKNSTENVNVISNATYEFLI